MAKKRLTWVDALKGFLMILVVVGHYPGDLSFPLAQYIYWFHMPAFFLLSGLFFKPVLEKGQLKGALYKRFMQLLVPYLFFVLLITVIRYGMEIGAGNFELSWYVQDLWTILVGGRFARGAYGVIWFVTTLFFTYMIFLFMTRYLNRTKQFILLAVFYIIAQLEGYVAMQVIGGAPDEASQVIPMLWNADVALIAVVYFAIGYYLKDFWMDISWKWLSVALSIAVAAFFLDWYGVIDYHLSMKFLRYDHPLLDLVIPVAITTVFVGLFQRVAEWSAFSWLSKVEAHSISIMYLHLLVNIMISEYVDYGVIAYSLFGIVIPIIASIAIRDAVPYGKLLLGGFRPRKRQNKHHDPLTQS